MPINDGNTILAYVDDVVVTENIQTEVKKNMTKFMEIVKAIAQ